LGIVEEVNAEMTSGSIIWGKRQAVATSADDGLLFPPERYPELTNQARQVGSSY
jgi:hypothetical protein